MTGKILIFGASGLVGGAALRHFDLLPDWQVVAVSRRPPAFQHGGEFIALDLTDRAACEAALGELSDVTHVVYAAVYEAPEVIRGWRTQAHFETNLAMLKNALEPLEAVASGFCHISLLQGTKAYGAHLRSPPVPAKERWPRDAHDNFYWHQEDYLGAARAGEKWTWTILRPQTVFGFALASPLNILTAMGVYAAIRREEGLGLAHPGGAPYVTQATDARLLARAFEWAASAEAAAGEVFNITNGDCMVYSHLWSVVAAHFAMELAPPEPMCLRDAMAGKAEAWETIRSRYNLEPIAYRDLVGEAWQFADFSFAAGKTPGPVIVSDVKARQHGFHDCIDTEDMLGEWLGILADQRILPP